MAELIDENSNILTDIGLGDLSSVGKQTAIQVLNQAFESEDKQNFAPATYEAWQKAILASHNNLNVLINQEQLKAFVPASIPYLSEEDKAYWQVIFSQAYVLSLFNYNRAKLLNRKQLHAPAHDECLFYKTQLRALAKHNENSKEEEQKFLILDDNWTPLTYLGFSLSAWYKRQIDEFLQAPSVSGREWLSDLNTQRLYWVWAGGNGGLIASIFDMDWIPGGEGASKVLEAPSNVFSYTSWILYYFRFSLEMSLLLKHTIKGPWMSEAEKNIDVGERFKTQWQQRKFVLMNDAVWGTVNLVTFFWWTTRVSEMRGVYGGVLTIALMFFDMLIAYWEYAEEQTKYNKAQLDLDSAIKTQKEKLKELAPGEDQTAIHQLIAELSEKKHILDFEWRYKQRKLRASVISSGLFIGFVALLYAPILPVMFPVAIPAVTLSLMVLIGGVLSVGVTVGESCYSAQQDVSQASQRVKLTEVKLIKIAAKLDKLAKKEQTDLTKNEMRLLLIEHRRLTCERDFNQAMTDHHKYRQLSAALSQLVFTAGVFGALFLPLPGTIAVIAALAALAMMVQALIKASEPKPVENAAVKLTKDEHDHPSKAWRAMERDNKDEQDVRKSSAVSHRHSIFHSPLVTEDTPELEMETLPVNKAD